MCALYSKKGGVRDLMTKKELLEKFSDWYENIYIPSQSINIKKAARLSEYSPNPFIASYAAKAMTRGTSPENVARAMITQRCFGTSMHTSFGNRMQKAITKIVPGAKGSAVSGLDIEFTSPVTKEEKFCQIKAGPYTVNTDSAKKIVDNFDDAIRLARTNGRVINNNQLIVGVLYGSQNELSSIYTTKIEPRYAVLTGEGFWYELTGYKGFYKDLIGSFRDISRSSNMDSDVDNSVSKLAAEIRKTDLLK